MWTARRRTLNLLVWRKSLRLIDHSAALCFPPFVGQEYLERSRDPFTRTSRNHVLLPYASPLAKERTSVLQQTR